MGTHSVCEGPKASRIKSLTEAARGKPILVSAIPPAGRTAGSLQVQREESKKKKADSRKITKRIFCSFALSAEGVFPKDSVSLFPS